LDVKYASQSLSEKEVALVRCIIVALNDLEHVIVHIICYLALQIFNSTQNCEVLNFMNYDALNCMVTVWLVQ